MSGATASVQAVPGEAPLHTLRYGSPADPAEVPVLLLHGQPGSASVWHRVGEELAGRGLHGLAVDRPGYGRSHRPASGFAANARALVEFLDHHRLDRVTVVAHSWAAGVALTLAAEAPERVQGLVLLAPVGADESVQTFDRLLALPVVGWGVLRAGLRLGAWLLDRDRTRRLLPAGFGDLEPMAAKRMAGSARSAGARRSAAVEQRVLVSELPDVRARLADVTAPVVVMAGSHDLIVPAAATESLSTALPSSGLRVVDAGHLLPAEVPELIVDAVQDVQRR